MTNFAINVESFKRVDLVTVAGRVDSSNASELDTVLQSLLNNNRHNIVLDLGQVSYMSSAGLRAVVSALRESKKNGGDLRLASPSERVTEVLELSGLNSLFEKFDDLTHAVGSF
ncbi:MAG: STAS domain-containing protein [Candidatus Promineifilaceae bacterium]